MAFAVHNYNPQTPRALSRWCNVRNAQALAMLKNENARLRKILFQAGVEVPFEIPVQPEQNLSGAVKTQRVFKRDTPGIKPLVRHAELLTAAISCEVNGKPSVRPAATLKPVTK